MSILNEEEYKREILGETKEIRDDQVQKILQWSNENPNIKMHTDIPHILYFLRSTKFDLDKAKIKIKRFYRMRSERTEWFSNRDPFLPELVELLDLGVFLPLKIKDNENRLVVIIRTSAHNPKKHNQNNVFKIGKMILDLALHLDENSISTYGITAIFDMKGVTLGHALQLTPRIIKRSVEGWEIYPCRTNQLEFINAPSYVNVMLNVFRSFMGAKMKSRVIINKESQCKINLPIDLGGSSESYADLAIYWKNLVQKHADWFIEDEKYKSIL